MRLFPSAVISVALGVTLAMSPAHAQQKTPPASDSQAQAFAGLIINMFQNGNGTVVCPGPNANPQTIGDGVIKYLKANQPPGQSGAISNEAVNNAMIALYPCPFSPFRDELVPAGAADLPGAWVYPNASQKFRYPPRAKVTLPTGGRPIACDGIGFYDKGEMRTALIPGPADCPYTKAADLEAQRANPRVLSWNLLSPGRLQVTRNDRQTQPEEWHTLLVKTAFEQHGVSFKAGDIVMYLRKSASNSNGVAEEFRHLQKLK